jgi:hypothetical protein
MNVIKKINRINYIHNYENLLDEQLNVVTQLALKLIEDRN